MSKLIISFFSTVPSSIIEIHFDLFNNMERNKIIEYARKNFDSEPEYLWAKSPNYFILRHKENKKWYAIVMDIPANKLGLDDTKIVDVLNVKLDVEYEPEILNLLLGTKGFFPAYLLSPLLKNSY